MLHQITFHCRTISPMFLSGPDTDMPELRPPSIKGALRFWTRAICLGWAFDNGTGRHENLLSRDEALFGGVTTGIQRSPVSISIRYNSFQTVTGRTLNLESGGRYLWYSLIADGYQKDRKGIAANEPFAVTLQSKDEIALKKAIASFWVLTYFGSLGTRARRGAGSFEVVHTEGYSLPEELIFSPGSDIKQFLSSGIHSVHRIFDVSREKRSEAYSTLGRSWVSRRFETWEEAINDIGQIMFKLRQPKRPNPQDDTPPRFTQSTLNQKAAFGLPVSVRLEKPNVVNFKEYPDGSHATRRASPVYITLVKGLSGIYWVVSKLEGIFKDDPYEIHFKNKIGRAFRWIGDDPEVLNEFFETIKRQAFTISHL